MARTSSEFKIEFVRWLDLLNKLGKLFLCNDELIERLRDIRSDSVHFLTLDVVELYPRINRHHLLDVLSRRIRSCDLMESRATLIIKLCEVALRFCVLSSGGQWYVMERGIPTGMQACVLLANAYLNDCDLHIMTCMPEHLKGALLLYARFVDDLLFPFRSLISK